MADTPSKAVGALEPLFGPSDLPDRHRTRAKSGKGATIVDGRRPSPIQIVRSLRAEVDDWRAAQYAGVSETSRTLLNHWFRQDHLITAPSGESFPFSYYFCQREAIETLVYLYELRRIRRLSALIASFGTEDREKEALGIAPAEDAWTRYAFKIATGAGKTKIMSLAIAWSYFHSLYENSDLARDFLIIAPGVTVFERLKEDFRPNTGGGNIFDIDPVIPSAWKPDWNVSVVLQDEEAPAATGGSIYLTNIHRLYDTTKRRSAHAETYDWAGPQVTPTKALDRSLALRKRIATHKRLMILNDEAHHVWDQGSAWNEAIRFLHNETEPKGGGIVAQLDLSATPRDDKGRVFRHVVCDTPLGEAVDAGIVKTPVIGRGDKLKERPDEDAAHRFETHLMLGYDRWKASQEEWEGSGKKALLFVMTENTEAADQIAKRLNTDSAFKELNGKTINLHTNLKGKIKTRGRGKGAYQEFIESDKEISDEDLEALRKLSRELDENSSPYRCIVSVLMLREGWDVRNVTTIVPLRPLTADSRILPEQTLGRGLRRMTPPGDTSAAETVTVIEHHSFIKLYEEELGKEGLPITVVDPDKLERTTLTVFPDSEHKDLDGLDLVLPRLSYAHHVQSELKDISFDAVRERFQEYGPLTLGSASVQEISYEGRTLVTNELVEAMKIKLPLLQNGIGAVSYYRELVERSCRVKGTHAVLAPLIQRFIEDLLFGEKVAIWDKNVISRLGDDDVREYIQAVFVELVREKTKRTDKRVEERKPESMTEWKPYQATHSDANPCETADHTPFNLVPCNRSLEVAMNQFLDQAPDVAAFAKNQGPQALRIDALTAEGIRTLYVPDFVVRRDSGGYFLVETKGTGFAKDPAVAAKAKAAQEWCRAASSKDCKWEYLYVPQKQFESFAGGTVEELSGACKPSLVKLVKGVESPQMILDVDSAQASAQVGEFIGDDDLEKLSVTDRQAIRQAVQILEFMASKNEPLFAPVFQPLLGRIDEAAEELLVGRLADQVPGAADKRDAFFEAPSKFLAERCRSLKRLLVNRNPLMPTGLAIFCLEYAGSKKEGASEGVLAVVKTNFADLAGTELEELITDQYKFRNTYVAHEKHEPLQSAEAARTGLRTWIRTLLALRSAASGSAVRA